MRQAGFGLDEKRRAGRTNQHKVTDHHCGPIRYQSVHGLEGRAETLDDGGLHADDVG